MKYLDDWRVSDVIAVVVVVNLTLTNQMIEFI